MDMKSDYTGVEFVPRKEKRIEREVCVLAILRLGA